MSSSSEYVLPKVWPPKVWTWAWRADKSGCRAARTRWLVKSHDVGSA